MTVYYQMADVGRCIDVENWTVSYQFNKKLGLVIKVVVLVCFTFDTIL